MSVYVRRIARALLLCFHLAMQFSTIPAPAQRAPDLTRSLTGALGAEGRVLWIDGTANVFRRIRRNGTVEIQPFTTTREGVAEVVRKSKAARIHTLVVDVKPLSGQVLYKSRFVPRMTEWQGKPIPDFDVLSAFVEEGHRAGLRVHASINVLSEGHKYYNTGLAYKNPDWQSIVYTVDRGLVAANRQRLSVRAPGEPDDPAKPMLLLNDSSILGGDPAPAIGLESAESRQEAVGSRGGTLPGETLYVTINADNRVEGMVDSALLGDDPLVAPEDGRILAVSRAQDRDWIARNLKTDDVVRFDLQTKLLPIAQAPSEKVACFVNPLHPAARKHQLDMIREIITNYDVDGIVLDRCRYSNIYNDFSDRTRAAFQQWLEAQARRSPKPKIPTTLNRWPQDIFAFNPVPGEPVVRGPLYNAWLEFRAQVIRDFVAEISRLVRSTKPQIALGAYVGSWYPDYYNVGVNWGSEKTHLRYSWMTEQYARTGYIEFLDWITTGCYHPIPSRQDARRAGLSERGSVEYLAELSSWAVANNTFVYAGLFLTEYQNKPEAFARALDAAKRGSQGWMLFDLVYLEEYNWWSLVERAAPNEAIPPETLRSLLAEIRSAMDSITR